MSLNYDLRKIVDSDTVCYTETDDGKFMMNAVTQEIIFGSIPVDMGEITSENYHEWYQRYIMWAAIKGLTPGFKREDVRNHIGLKVNVSTMTLHSWLTKRLKWFMETEQLNVQRMVREEADRATSGT